MGTPHRYYYNIGEVGSLFDLEQIPQIQRQFNLEHSVVFFFT